MTPKQAKQYEAMATAAEVKIDEENLTATGILAEYMRLKQFAGAHQKVKHMADGSIKVQPTYESGKLPVLMELLDERGIRPDSEGDDSAEGDEQVVIFSQFASMVNMITDYLNENGIKAEKITGAVSQKRRTELVEEFQSGEVRVMVVSTTAGGVALTLDRASTAIIMDETWDPDDQEQAEDRVHRASRIHQVTVYYLRTRDTIEEYIKSLVGGKAVTNREILDLRRMGLTATGIR
jgi:SNF2 family DNA or RNA helicase